MTSLLVRDARGEDFASIREIYAHHVLHGAGTFEEESPALEEMMRRHEAVRANGLPWLVAERESAITGYAYAQLYHVRSAYRRTLEDSVYVAPGNARAGIGKALLAALLSRCAALGYREMIAVIGDSGNDGSISLHSGAGFVHAGVLKNVGFKFGRYVDVVLMQKSLQDP